MHNFILDEGLERVEDLDEELNSFFLGDGFIFLEILWEISFVAVFEDEVEVVGSLFDVIQLDDVLIVTSPQHFDLVFQQLKELP